MQNNNWKDKEGEMHYGMKVTVANIEYLNSIRDTEDQDDFMSIADGLDDEMPFN